MRAFVASLLLLAWAGCTPPSDEDDPDVVPPVTGRDDIEAWFRADHYQHWTCEDAPHPAIDPSPHGIVRLCANPIIASDAPGERPLDSAMVIEIRNTGGVLVGRGAQRHTSVGTDGANWYWYMRVPADSETPHDASGLAADGWGFEGPALDVCTACHSQAGEEQHVGHDFVWVVP